MKSIAVNAFAICAVATGCTTLGPMPATTGVSAVPDGRTGVEGQLGVIPAFNLSQATQAQTHGDATGQVSLLFEPGKLLDLPGVIAGVRVWGQGGDTPTEPYVGYRAMVGDGLALAGILYGTVARASDDGASYRAVRFGGELAGDALFLRPATWLGVHALASVSATAIAASGTYCVDPTTGYGADCNQDGTDTIVNARLSGVFPAGTIGIAFDFAHLPHSWFHGVRIAALLAGGDMPVVYGGVQDGHAFYGSAGMTLTVGLGER